MHKFLFQITVFIYFISAAGFIVHIITLRKDAERIAAVFLSVGFGFHTAAVLMRWFAGGHPPLVNLHAIVPGLGNGRFFSPVSMATQWSVLFSCFNGNTS